MSTMSNWTWAALALLLVIVTGYFVVTQTKADIERRVKWGRPEPQELGLIEALDILVRAGAAPVLAWFRRKPVRKHSIAYVGAGSMFVSDIRLQVLNSA